MKQIILGTAGHIDHGKTALIKTVTGINTDRLKEEKLRGITIELGFASMELPSGQHLGVVDVPGHEKFVKNMVAGATGIDMVAMVIAADEGGISRTPLLHPSTVTRKVRPLLPRFPLYAIVALNNASF